MGIFEVRSAKCHVERMKVAECMILSIHLFVSMCFVQMHIISPLMLPQSVIPKFDCTTYIHSSTLGELCSLKIRWVFVLHRLVGCIRTTAAAVRKRRKKGARVVPVHRTEGGVSAGIVQTAMY